MLELFDDKRFIYDCNDSQKLDYILWMAMAGITQNNAEANSEWFVQRFNLVKKFQEVDENLLHLLKTFKRMKKNRGRIKFNKFNEIHNYIGKSQGNPKEIPRMSQNRIDIDKNINTIAKKKPTEPKVSSDVNSLMGVFKKLLNPQLNFANKTERKACENLLKNSSLKDMTVNVELIKEHQEKGTLYMPVITTPYEMYTKLAKLEIFFNKNQ